MNAEQIKAILRRLGASTGPRLISGHKSWAGENPVLTEEGHPVAICGEGDQAKADAEFFAHARSDVPDLIGEVQRLRAGAASALDALERGENNKGGAILAALLRGDI